MLAKSSHVYRVLQAYPTESLFMQTTLNGFDAFVFMLDFFANMLCFLIEFLLLFSQSFFSQFAHFYFY